MTRPMLLLIAVACLVAPCRAQTSAPPDIATLRDQAARNSPEAATQLGDVYRFGIGVPVDFAMAVLWYEKAAAAGYAPAMTRLGVMYREGRGVAKDDAKAREWWEKAAAAGDEKALAYLRQMSL